MTAVLTVDRILKQVKTRGPSSFKQGLVSVLVYRTVYDAVPQLVNKTRVWDIL